MFPKKDAKFLKPSTSEWKRLSQTGFVQMLKFSGPDSNMTTVLLIGKREHEEKWPWENIDTQGKDQVITEVEAGVTQQKDKKHVRSILFPTGSHGPR